MYTNMAVPALAGYKCSKFWFPKSGIQYFLIDGWLLSQHMASMDDNSSKTLS
jgi:hypothetical protein